MERGLDVEPEALEGEGAGRVLVLELGHENEVLAQQPAHTRRNGLVHKPLAEPRPVCQWG